MHQFKPQVSYGSPYGRECSSSPCDLNLDSMLQYYSAPTSPIRRIGSIAFGYESADVLDMNNDTNANLYKFVNFQGFCNDSEFEQSPKLEDQYEEMESGAVKRVDSLPTMAFADELFLNGQVKPLNLPPRLQHGNATPPCRRSPTMSPTSVINISFARRNMWNDDFDPFMVALDKVREENKGRKSVHRRSRSESPFRPMSVNSSPWNLPLDSHCTNVNNTTLQQPEPEKLEPLENGLVKPKGLAYSRWALSGSMGHKRSSSLVSSSPKVVNKLKGLSFRKKVKELKMGHEEPKDDEQSEGNSSGDVNKMEKVKGIIKRYASLKKEKSENKVQVSTMWKPIHFKNLSSKFRGKDSHEKKVGKASNRAIVTFKPTKLTLCLGYGGDSPSPRF